ncbi:MAG TPA: translation initiation factor [Haliangium sp.]|nr:translation initiation factor [Haliangium sp.]
MAKKKHENDAKADQSKAGSPFAALAGLRDALPAGPAPAQVAPPQPHGEPRAARGPARAVVRLERKGRGGKEVTRIEKLGLGVDELERWCGELKKALGCGGTVEGDALVLHGDLRPRVEPLLLARGVRKVTMG